MKKAMMILAVMFLVALCATTAVWAGGGSSQPMFNMIVRGIPNWEVQTNSFMYAQINPPFYTNGEGNIPFQRPLHADNFTVGYWMEGSDKWSTQTFAQPYPSGDFMWEGHIEVGVNDMRSTQTFDWWVNNSSPDLNWWLQMYRCDTRSIVHRQLIEPGATNNWGTIVAPTSRTGYDILVAAWNPNPVPEPGSAVAVLSGLIGLAGIVRRRRS